MTYRVRNISIAIALALVAALLTSYYVSNFQRNVRADESNVRVFVAARDIPAGTAGEDARRLGLLTQTEIVRRSVVPGAVSAPSQLDGLVAAHATFAGEQVSTRRFVTPAQRGVRAELRGNQRAISGPGDAFQLLAGTLRAGDRVDVVASLKLPGDAEAHATRIVLRDIRVLKAPQSVGADLKLTNGASGGLSVLLAVTDTQVQKLFFVMENSDWTLQLRPPVKAADSPERIVSVGSLLRDGISASRLSQLENGGN